MTFKFLEIYSCQPSIYNIYNNRIVYTVIPMGFTSHISENSIFLFNRIFKMTVSIDVNLIFTHLQSEMFSMSFRAENK